MTMLHNRNTMNAVDRALSVYVSSFIIQWSVEIGTPEGQYRIYAKPHAEPETCHLMVREFYRALDEVGISARAHSIEVQLPPTDFDDIGLGKTNVAARWERTQ